MKNLSTDSNIIIFPFKKFQVLTIAKYKHKITDLITNFNRKIEAYSGRGAVFTYNDLVIRQYRHGGIFRNILKESFLSPERFENEFKIFLYLNDNGFPTAKAVGSLIRKQFLFQGFIVTEKIPNVKGLSVSFNGELFFNAGKTAKNLHNLNIIHGDMHLDNFLCSNDKKVYLIDFDKSFFSKNEKNKLKDVKRFIRSVLKHNYFHGNKIEPELIEYFLSGYGSEKNLLIDMKITFKNKISWFLNKH
jgi:tRNA A-37 threonylcarbamoyl transferase component Bud32